MRFFYFLVVVFFSSILSAQRFAVVDTKYILENLPEYEAAEKSLEEKVAEWSTEIQRLEKKLDEEKLDLENKKILLTEDQYQERVKLLEEKELNIKEARNKRYGADGDMVKLRINLVVPIQNKIFNTVKLISEREKYAFVFDKSSDLIVIYSDPTTTYDITKKVLNFLKPQQSSTTNENEDLNNTKTK